VARACKPLEARNEETFYVAPPCVLPSRIRLKIVGGAVNLFHRLLIDDSILQIEYSSSIPLTLSAMRNGACMHPTLNFYMDDSGTRAPNHQASQISIARPDFFAMGGILIADEDEAAARALHESFCFRWGIEYPLHSVEIRHSSQNFKWLQRGTHDYQAFMWDLTRMLSEMRIVGLACVIDRPGYEARYRQRHGRRQWHLCKTAFTIAVERAAKHALSHGRRLRVLPERCGDSEDGRIREYFHEMRLKGAPFDPKSSAAYSPLTPSELAATLYELRFKSKSSPMAQVADLLLWPMAIAGYDADYRPYAELERAGKFIECQLPERLWAERASKYSCFERLNEALRGLQKQQRPRRMSEPSKRPPYEDPAGYARHAF
jgi:hypothetical protein